MYSNNSNSGVLHSFDLDKLPEDVDQNQVKETILNAVQGTGVNKLRHVDRDINVFTSKVDVPAMRTFTWNKIDIVAKEDQSNSLIDAVIKPALRAIGVDLDLVNGKSQAQNRIFPFYAEKSADFQMNEHGNVEVKSFGTKTEYSSDGQNLVRTMLDR